MKARLMLTRLLYLAPNERYDRFMRDLQQAEENTLEQANQGEKASMAKLLHLSDVSLLAKFAREQLGS
jgi:digeranylgeranylglycerophospholipid reductase